MKRLAEIAFVYLILGCLFLSAGGLPASAQILPNLGTRRAQVTISASLGEPVLRLWGYGSANSRVELSGRGVADFAYSRSDGYYEFSKAFLPAPTDFLYPELCLTAIDQTGRATPPTCIPALPANEFSYDIGPIILPPTLSLEAGSTTPDTQVAASGMTIPNSEVKIVLAEGGTGNAITKLSIVTEVSAYYIPNYTVKSDSQGYFNFNMPATTSDKWRMFAITNYSQVATSPKSNTLTFEVISPALAAAQKFWKLILSLFTLPVLISFEILIILVLIALLLVKRGKKKVSPTISNKIDEYQAYLISKRLPKI
ncbi:MAG: hypothetical protein UV71_C0002G0004 [Microgenomates group bacterium GW2011_GWC1_43_13]|nr:MAG: hypothetical protein UV71_C0002G0004 [Microgenomates group bacterium GW2011_GWC1_43_13]